MNIILQISELFTIILEITNTILFTLGNDVPKMFRNYAIEKIRNLGTLFKLNHTEQ